MITHHVRNWRLVAAFLAASLCLGALPTLAAQAQVVDPNSEVEAKVRAAFADIPIMIDIAKCESRFRQFSAPGQVLHGGTNKKYLGIFQISEQLHATIAAAMGDDIFTVDGNIAYARYLYSRSGTVPWRGCLPAVTVPAKPIITVPAAAIPDAAATSHAPNPSSVNNHQLSLDLMVGIKHEQVRTLQQILNHKGFVITNSGAGAPGSETTMFGVLTRDAVRRFQCAQKIVCEGSETTTGFGRIGPKTRLALLND